MPSGNDQGEHRVGGAIVRAVKITSRHPRSALASSILAAALAGCSGPPSSDAPAGHAAPSVAHPSVTPATAARAEQARVQSFLEGLYRRDDVVHAFRSAAGQDIDCVDFASEPGVRQLLSEGYSLDDLHDALSLTPEQLAYNERLARRAPSNFAGDPDESGRVRRCPEGSVPHVRVTAERVADAGGLDAYVARTSTKTPPPSVRPFGCPYPPTGGYQWLVGGWAESQGTSVGNQGGFVTMAVADPTGQTVVDHSIAQTWTSATSGCNTQTVETGWIVDESVNGDYLPHVFIYATASTYGATPGAGSGCWNNVGPGCVTWVQSTSDFPPGAVISPWSTPGNPQQEFTFSTRHVYSRYCRRGWTCYLGWQISFLAPGKPWEVMGYYANSAYGTGPLATAADAYQIGTEVYSANPQPAGQTPYVAMGEGPTIFAPTPTFSPQYYGAYAYFHDFYTYSPAATVAPAAVHNYVGGGTSSTLCTGPGCLYMSPGVDVGGGDPGTPWNNYWYYGDVY